MILHPRALFIAGIAAALAVVAARAGLDVPPAPPAAPDLSGFATKGDLGAIQSQIPQPASTMPPMEAPGGAVGTTNTFRRGDAVQPRITRSKTLTLAADGTATFDWTAQGALVAPVQVVMGPVYAGSGAPKCWATASSATAASIKCVVEAGTSTGALQLNLGVITGGININGGSAAGMQVGVVVLPAS